MGQLFFQMTIHIVVLSQYNTRNIQSLFMHLLSVRYIKLGSYTE